MVMPGNPISKMVLRPILSMEKNATKVKIKLVPETMIETAEEFLKPTVSKMVPEKYINEFQPVNC